MPRHQCSTRGSCDHGEIPVGTIPDAHAPNHKIWAPNYINTLQNIDASVRGADVGRRTLDIPQILKQFDYRFKQGQIFRSASEFCEIHMVPEGESLPGSLEDGTSPSAADDWGAEFWSKNRLTGENIRERIYATTYPRVTTKSNTFTVHMIAQDLRKVPGTSDEVWDEQRDRVAGEYRGSTTIERYIDPNNPDIPDFATGFKGRAGDPSLDHFYRWRVIQNRQFGF